MQIPEEIITSRQNRYVSECAGLSDRKRRDSAGLFRADGLKLYAEAVLRGVSIAYVLLREHGGAEVAQTLSKVPGVGGLSAAGRVLVVKDSVFDSLTSEKSPEGIITVGKHIDKIHDFVTINNNTAFEGEFFVLLESLQDPNNVGTILRTCAAMGVDRVILSGDCADLYHPRTLRAAMGPLFSLPCSRVDSIPKAIAALRRAGHRVFAAALSDDALELGGTQLLRGDCVVIGNEGHGLSSETVGSCDCCLKIPMESGVESLNAAAAAAVLLWNFRCAGH